MTNKMQGKSAARREVERAAEAPVSAAMPIGDVNRGRAQPFFNNNSKGQ